MMLVRDDAPTAMTVTGQASRAGFVRDGQRVSSGRSESTAASSGRIDPPVPNRPWRTGSLAPTG
jgi:hypothetical protein